MYHNLGSRRQSWSLGQIMILLVLAFMTLHGLQWAVRCGPLASGKYRDYCADLDRARKSKPILINETTVARSVAVSRTPYIDLKDTNESLEAFLPQGWGLSKNNANVREGPGMNYDIIDSLPKDSLVEIIEEDGGWLKVRINASGDAEHFGWVWRDLLAR